MTSHTVIVLKIHFGWSKIRVVSCLQTFRPAERRESHVEKEKENLTYGLTKGTLSVDYLHTC